MATQVKMPQLGESVTEGTITRWLKRVGDPIAKYDALCEVETDKVTAEVPATESGTLTQIIVEEGTTVAVGEVICYIQTEGEEEQPVSKPQVKQSIIQTLEEDTRQEVHTSEQNYQQKIRYSPAVLKLAQEHHLDLSCITGTGEEGRITRKDVLRYLENPQAQSVYVAQSVQEDTRSRQPAQEPFESAAITQSVPIQTQPVQSQAKNPAFPIEEGDQVIEVNQVRKTIARRMVQSKREAPHAWMTVEADVTELVHYRDKIKDEFKRKEGFNITYLPFFIKAVVEAIKEYPIINSVWAEDKIILKKRINISIAVATDDALYVPVIKDADQKSIYGIAKEIDHLVKKTKAGKLALDDLSGGTFTVNNTGSFGSVLSAPILNHPQAGIITMESITKKPVVIHDMIAIRSMVNLCMSLDHRILDGLVTGRFVQKVKENLENMGKSEIRIY